MNGLRQLRDATGEHQVGWKSLTVDDDETASQQHGEESQTGIEVQCRAELGIQGPPVWNWCAQEHEASESWQECQWRDLSDVGFIWWIGHENITYKKVKPMNVRSTLLSLSDKEDVRFNNVICFFSKFNWTVLLDVDVNSGHYMTTVLMTLMLHGERQWDVSWTFHMIHTVTRFRYNASIFRRNL